MIRVAIIRQDKWKYDLYLDTTGYFHLIESGETRWSLGLEKTTEKLKDTRLNLRIEWKV